MIDTKIILPVYNEELGIQYFHRYIKEYLINLQKKERFNGFQFELLYIVDRCTDKTLNVLSETILPGDQARVISMSARFGHQASILAGIDISFEADAIIMMDSDLQHPPELIELMLEEYLNGNDVVYTTRITTDKIGYFRRIIGNIFYWLINKLSDVYINPNSTDFRLISSRVAKVISLEIKERGVFLRGLFSWVGFKQANIEYIANARKFGVTKYSISDLFKLATGGIISFSTKPLRIGIHVGIFFALLAFVMSGYAILDYFLDKNIPSGWTTLAVLLLFFSGLQLIMMGIVGLYIGGIHKEVKNRPHYIIEKIIEY